MNIFKIIRKKRNKRNDELLPDLYDFTYESIARRAREAAKAADLPDLPDLTKLRSTRERIITEDKYLPDLPDLTKLRSARGKIITEDEYLPDLIGLSVKREKGESVNKDSVRYKSRIMQNSLTQLKKYYISDDSDDYGDATIDDYYSVFNDVNDKSERKFRKLKSRDLTKDYRHLKYQSWTLILLLIGIIWVLFASINEMQDFKYTFKTVQVLAQVEEIPDILATVEYDETQDRNLFRKYNMRYINQLSEGLPNGCEVVSLAMVLSQFIFDISPHEIVEKYLPRMEIGVYNGTHIGEDPTHYYIGDPAGKGYGIFAEGLSKAAENTLKAYKMDGVREVVNISGCSEEELFGYVTNGHPVIVWGTVGLVPVQRWSYSWHLPTGQLYWYPGNQHCFVLVEFTEDKVVVYDPRDGQVTYDRSLFIKRWNEMGPYEDVTRQAIVIK